jgi:hypothetical protein
MLDHQLVQLAGADTGIFGRTADFAFVAGKQLFEILPLKIINGLPPGYGQL